MRVFQMTSRPMSVLLFLFGAVLGCQKFGINTVFQLNDFVPFLGWIRVRFPSFARHDFASPLAPRLGKPITSLRMAG